MNTQLPTAARTVRLANATPERLREVTARNLAALEAILAWNEAHGVQQFRLTSNLIPFGSHEANSSRWWDEFRGPLRRIGEYARRAGARLSTHPGQYTVLASVRGEVVTAAVAELEYHARLLTTLGLDRSHKIVLHVGPTDSEAAGRFADGFERLSESARARLVLENDERWPLERVGALARSLALPVVFDVFHHQLAPSFAGLGVRDLVLLAGETWHPSDGRQKMHFSTQEPSRRAGAHAATLDLDAFASFHDEVGDLPLDCMLEVKDKEQSVLKAMHLLVESDAARVPYS